MFIHRVGRKPICFYFGFVGYNEYIMTFMFKKYISLLGPFLAKLKELYGAGPPIYRGLNYL